MKRYFAILLSGAILNLHAHFSTPDAPFQGIQQCALVQRLQLAFKPPHDKQAALRQQETYLAAMTWETDAWQQLKALIVKIPEGDLFDTPDTRLEEAKRIITFIAPVHEMGFVNDIFMSTWRRIITPRLSAAEPLIQPHALHMDWDNLAAHIVKEVTPAFLKPHRFVLDIPKLKAVLSGTQQIKDPRDVWIAAEQPIQTSLLELVRQMADRAILEVRKVHIEETPNEHRMPNEHIDIVKHRVGEILRSMHEEWNIQAWENNQYPAMAPISQPTLHQLRAHTLAHFNSDDHQIIYEPDLTRHVFTPDGHHRTSHSLRDLDRPWGMELFQISQLLHMGSEYSTKQTVLKLYERLIAFRNTFPLLFSFYGRTRKEVFPQARSILLHMKRPIPLPIVVGNQFGGGLLGKSHFISLALQQLIPLIQPRIYLTNGGARPSEISFESTIPIDLYPPDLVIQNPFLSIGMQIDLRNQRPFETSHHLLYWGTLPTSLNRRDFDPHEVSRFTTNDLFSPSGTLLYDRTLESQKEHRDQLTPDEIISHRFSWLRETLPGPAFQSLNTHFSTLSADLAKSIWTLSYIRDTHRYLKELDALKAHLIQHPIRALPYYGNGNRLLIVHLENHWQTKTFHWSYYTQRGMSVVLQSGHVIEGDAPRVPVTVYYTPPLSNLQVRAFLSLYAGTLQRDPEGHYIGFPVYITGSASEAEAISTGAIALHDNFDCTQNGRFPAILMNVMHLLMMENPTENWLPLLSQARSLTQNFMQGEDRTEYGYNNLMAWTRLAKDYQQALSHFSLVDQIIIYLASLVDPHFRPTSLLGAA